jgi:hypothetical protein
VPLIVNTILKPILILVLIAPKSDVCIYSIVILENVKNGDSEPEPESDDDRREELEPDSESGDALTIITMLGITT